jgi:hypothetical protein
MIQTIGYKTSASNANGQQRKKRISQRIKADIGYLLEYIFFYDDLEIEVALRQYDFPFQFPSRRFQHYFKKSCIFPP